MNSLDQHREAIDAALAAGATKASIARTLGVTIASLYHYLNTRDLKSRVDDSGVTAALARLAADVQA